MVSNEILIGISLFVVLIIIVVAIVVTSSTANKPPSNSGIPTDTTVFLAPCGKVTCGAGFICDETLFICKNPPGALCSSAGDCTSGYFCSGRCVTGTTGSLDQYCPCLPGYLCDQQEDGYAVCKGASGASCSTGTDCFSLTCKNSVCLGGY